MSLPNEPPRKSQRGHNLDDRPRGLISARSAVVLGGALIAAVVVGVLLYVAHPIALAVVGGLGAFAIALPLLDKMIER